MNLITENEKNEKNIKDHPNTIVFSYSLATLGMNALYGMILTNTFYFYENFSGLSIATVGIVYIIFTIWDTINDPLLGILSDKPTKISRKWGRRFPWIIGAIIPIILFSILIYRPPVGVPALTFVYMLVVLIVYEVFFTLFSINHSALYPDKFRTQKNRNFYSIISNVLSLAGTGIGMILPFAFIDYDDPSTFTTGTLIVSGIVLVPLLLSIPGCREDKEMIERFNSVEIVKTKKGQTWKSIKTIFRNKNFLASFLVSFGIQILSACAMMSIPYFVTEVLDISDDFVMLVFGGQIAGTALGILIWIPFMKKVNYVKAYIGCTFLTIGAMIPIMWINTLTTLVILATIVGISVSGIMITSTVMYGDIIDETVIITEERREGAYSGIAVLANLISPAFAILIISASHLLTGYQTHEEGVSIIQTPEAKFGIRLHFALIPLIICLIAILLFMKMYKLTPTIAEDNRKKLVDLGF
ncbi:MAG: MFS transporter [Promethearchaeota archaeon]